MRSEFLKQQSPKVLKIVKFDESVNAFVLHDHLDLTEINLSALAEINYGWDLWQHQQSKVDELQKQNAWLSGVACRENKRANKLQEEKVSTTTLLGKTIQEKNELQKRVDSTLKVVQSMRNEVKHGHMSDEEAQMLSSFADELEQALKGGLDETN